MKQLFANNAATALVGDLASVDLVLTVANDADLPHLAANQFFLLTLIGLDGNGNEAAWEIVRVTGRNGKTLNVVRAQEGTVARTWANGTLIEARLTAGSLAGKEDAIAAGSVAHYWRGDKTWRDLATDVRAVVLSGLSIASAAAVTATDSILAAIGKLQGQINALAAGKLDAGATAASATRLAVARTINGKPFDGTANIDVTDPTSIARAGDTITGKISVGSTANRSAGMYGIYDSTKTGHVWSMGPAYTISDDGSDFGNLYGIAYKHTNNATGGTMAGGHQIVFCSNGVPGAAIGLAGGIWTSGNVSAYSDIRIKTNIQTIPDALDKVRQLRGVTFERTDRGGERQTGLIAQDVQRVLPEAVVGDEMLSVAYGNLAGLLVEAIKELEERLAALEDAA